MQQIHNGRTSGKFLLPQRDLAALNRCRKGDDERRGLMRELLYGLQLQPPRSRFFGEIGVVEQLRKSPALFGGHDNEPPGGKFAMVGGSQRYFQYLAQLRFVGAGSYQVTGLARSPRAQQGEGGGKIVEHRDQTWRAERVRARRPTALLTGRAHSL